MFSDEKIFLIDGGNNRQNDRVLAVSRENANKSGGNLYFCEFLVVSHKRSKFVLIGVKGLMKFPLSIMVWVGLTTEGATKPYFVQQGEY